jgi:hypothetical protein
MHMTESHLRRLAITIRALEEELREVEGALEPPPAMTMTVYRDDVPAAAHRPIRERIEQLRGQIGQVKERYALSPQVVSNRRRIGTKLSLLSVNLTEATSRYMRAYGELPKEEQAELDERMTKLIALVNDLNIIVGRNP